MLACYLTSTGLVADSMRRARSAQAVLEAGANGNVEITPAVLWALSKVADRVALDLSLADRNLALEGVS